MCYNIFSASGINGLSRRSDETAANMTSADFSKIQVMAEKYMSSK